MYQVVQKLEADISHVLLQFHGTSTVANDKNESNAYNEQFRHLGRAVGNACPVIAQKWLTGHRAFILMFTHAKRR